MRLPKLKNENNTSKKVKSKETMLKWRNLVKIMDKVDKDKKI